MEKQKEKQIDKAVLLFKYKVSDEDDEGGEVMYIESNPIISDQLSNGRIVNMEY